MSKPNTDDKEETEGAQSAQTKPLAEDIIVKLDDSQIDEGSKQALKQMFEQNKQQMKMIEEQTKIIQEMNTERQLAKRDIAIEEKLAEIEIIKPGLSAKYKDEKDLGVLNGVIKLSKEWKKEEEFDEIAGETPEGQTEDDVMKAHWKPPGAKKPTAKLFDYKT